MVDSARRFAEILDVLFFRELTRGLIGIPATALGVLLIAVFFQVGAEEATGWWQAILSFGVALAVTAVAAAIIGWAADRVLATAAIGWFGLFSGRTPKEFGAKQKNGVRAAANLILLAISVPLGIMLFRRGVQQDMANWAITGLFFAGSGVLFGLGPAVPRIYFASRGRDRRPLEDVDGQGVTGFFIAALIGVGLSLAVSFGLADDSGKGPRVMRLGRSYQVCAVGKKEDESKICPKIARLIVPTAPSSKQWLIEYSGRCFPRVWQGETMIKPMSWLQLRRLKIKTYEKTADNEVWRKVFSAKAGLAYEIRAESRSAKKTCFSRVMLKNFVSGVPR